MVSFLLLSFVKLIVSPLFTEPNETTVLNVNHIRFCCSSCLISSGLWPISELDRESYHHVTSVRTPQEALNHIKYIPSPPSFSLERNVFRFLLLSLVVVF